MHNFAYQFHVFVLITHGAGLLLSQRVTRAGIDQISLARNEYHM